MSPFPPYWEATEAYELFYDVKATRVECPLFVKSVKKTKVQTAVPSPGKKMLFLFDYGDEWQFRVGLISVETAQRKKLYPVCIKSVGKARTQYDEPDELEELCRIDDEEDDK